MTTWLFTIARHEVTAALLGVSLAATKSRLHRARMSLAALVRGEG